MQCRTPISKEGVVQAFLGLNRLSSDTEEVRELVGNVAALITRTVEYGKEGKAPRILLSRREIEDSLCSLHYMRLEHEEVRALLSALALCGGDVPAHNGESPAMATADLFERLPQSLKSFDCAEMKDLFHILAHMSF